MRQETDALMHYGVLGMKWGVRRANSKTSKATKPITDRQIKKARRKDVKNRRMLSDQDLISKIGRLEREKRLRELTDTEINGGRTIVKDVMKSAGKKTASTVVSGGMLYGIKAAITGKTDIADFASYVTPKPKNK